MIFLHSFCQLCKNTDTRLYFEFQMLQRLDTMYIAYCLCMWRYSSSVRYGDLIYVNVFVIYVNSCGVDSHAYIFSFVIYKFY